MNLKEERKLLFKAIQEVANDKLPYFHKFVFDILDKCDFYFLAGLIIWDIMGKNHRVVDLALHHRKARVRKKNMNRIRRVK